MELEKITKKKVRRYHDACGAAHGLDLVGERWALLVVRELMFGPRRFGDLRADLCGLSANVLTQRLEGLEAAGIVRRRRLPAPASVQVYELTEWGLEAEPIFQALGRWAARSPGHDPSLPISAASLMLSFRTMFDPARAGDLAMDLALVFGETAFRVRVRGEALTVAREAADGADLTVAAEPAVVAALVYGEAPLAALGDAVTVVGDKALLQRFIDSFALPPKAQVNPASGRDPGR